MNVLLLPFGSAGDVHPFIGLGLELKKRGHVVTVITNGYFREQIEKAGFVFVESGPREEFENALDNPDLWHPTKSLKTLAEISILPQIPILYELVRKHATADTVTAAGSLAFGARLAQEKLGIPLATVHLQPSVLRSEYETPIYPGTAWMSGLPRFMKRLLFILMDKIVAGIYNERMNAFRASIGLAPLKRIFFDWWNSPQLTIGMFPDWYAAPQPDWPASVKLTGFPLFDGAGVEKESPGLADYLAQGEPPIVFTAGSAMKTGDDFFAASAKACEILGRRGLFLTRFASQLPSPLPSFIRHFEYAPFSQVLRSAAAFVHHGGIGTTSQALKAGVPQLIMPLSHDQPDNAARIKRLGVGSFIARPKYKPEAVAAELKQLIQNPDVKKNCAAVAARMDGNGLKRAADLIEGLRPRL